MLDDSGLAYLGVYWLLAVFTYGLSVPSGLCVTHSHSHRKRHRHTLDQTQHAPSSLAVHTASAAAIVYSTPGTTLRAAAVADDVVSCRAWCRVHPRAE